MRRTLKSAINRLGYDIRCDKVFEKAFPYIESFAMDDMKFNYWITSQTYQSWYNPVAWCRSFEAAELKRIIQKGDRVLEIGCNNGFTTCLISRLAGDTGFVLGIDIVPMNCLVANASLGLNMITNSKILNIAAAERPEILYFVNDFNGIIVNKKLGDAHQIDAIACDSLMSEFGTFNLLKIDCEGFEVKVLRGCKQLLSTSPKLAIEVHKDNLRTYGDNVEELLSLINIEEYEGMMYSRAEHTLEKFDLEKFNKRTDGILNLFLTPKK